MNSSIYFQHGSVLGLILRLHLAAPLPLYAAPLLLLLQSSELRPLADPRLLSYRDLL